MDQYQYVSHKNPLQREIVEDRGSNCAQKIVGGANSQHSVEENTKLEPHCHIYSLFSKF